MKSMAAASLIFAFPVQAATVSFDLSIFHIAPPSNGELVDRVRYVATVSDTPDAGPVVVSPDGTVRYDYSLLSLRASISGVSTVFAPADILGKQFSIFQLDRIAPGGSSAYVFEIPVPTLMTTALENEGPLSFRGGTFYQQNPTLPNLGGNANDFLALEPSNTNHEFDGNQNNQVLNAQGHEVVGIFSDYWATIGNTTVNIPEPSSILLGNVSLLLLLLKRRRG